MYYLTDGLGAKPGCKAVGRVLAVLFACFCILASSGIGNMSQIKSIAGNMKDVYKRQAEGYLEARERSSFYVQEYLALPERTESAAPPQPEAAPAPEQPVRYDLSTCLLYTSSRPAWPCAGVRRWKRPMS